MKKTSELISRGILIAAIFLSMILGAYLYMSNSAKTVVIYMDENGFSPAEIIIKKGDSVSFMNGGKSQIWPASNLHPTHELYSEFDPRAPIQPSESWTFVLDRAGVWSYHDHKNPAKGGRIVVIDKKAMRRQDSSRLFEKKDEKDLLEIGKPIMSKISLEKNETTKQEMVRDLTYQVGPAVVVKLFNNFEGTRTGQTHLLAHVVGEVAYELYGDKALPYCNGDMLNGCAHGLMLTAISDIGVEGVKNMVRNCKDGDSLFSYHMCLHAAGHGFFAFVNYDDLFSALDFCKTLDTDQNNVSHCYNGVFMENTLGDHGNRWPPQHPWLDKNDLLFPCNKVDDIYKAPCYLNQTSWWFVYIFNQDSSKVLGQCLKVPKDYQRSCINSFGRMVSTMTANDPARILKECGQVPKNLAPECFSSIAASSFAIGDHKLPFMLCAKIQNSTEKTNCYEALSYLFKITSMDENLKQQLCETFRKEYKEVCL